MITKQTKKRQIEMDLKPLIYEMKVLNLKDLNGINVSNPELLAMGTENGIEEIPALFLKACTGSTDNVKPELILEAFCRFHNLPYDCLGFQIHRLEVYAKSKEVPVKGEKERSDYQRYLDKEKKRYQREGKTFPEFIALGMLGKDII